MSTHNFRFFSEVIVMNCAILPNCLASGDAVMNRSHELRVASSAPVRTGYLTSASLTASYEKDEVVQVSYNFASATPKVSYM